MLKKVVLGLLCALLGATFIFSGYTKLYPIEPFEYTFVDIGFINWQIAPFIARILIGLEFLIGFLLLFNIYLHKVTYKLGIGMLILFCVYLLLLMAFSGNKGNCGCFGSYIQMTPLQALIKNIIMLVIFFVLNKYYKGRIYKSFFKGLLVEIILLVILGLAIWSGILIWYELKNYLNWQSNYLLIVAFAISFLPFIVIIYFITKIKPKIIDSVFETDTSTDQQENKKTKLLFDLAIIASFAMPFILNPVELDYSAVYLNRPEENYKLELDSLYNNAKPLDNASVKLFKQKELSKGKQIIMFMSLTCPHCRIAANKIRIMHERHPEIPFYMVLNGDDENLKPFFENTHTEDIPHSLLIGHSYVYLAGLNMPAIYLVNNGIVEHDINYMDLDEGEIEKWVKK